MEAKNWSCIHNFFSKNDNALTTWQLEVDSKLPRVVKNKSNLPTPVTLLHFIKLLKIILCTFWKLKSNFAPPLDLEVTMAFSILSLVGLLAALAELPFKCLADVPRCDRENPDFTHSPYCLPYDYNLDIIPPMDGPLVINVDIFVFEVSILMP